jgi:ubiquinone/menaquinone biosynthesis C-methylase UbiE
VRWAALLDPWLYRRPFTGGSARRYARLERPGFGDLDRRLCEAWRADLAASRAVVDLGAGPGTLAPALCAAFPDLDVIEIEPSADFERAAAVAGPAARIRRVRALAEALPLATACVDGAVSVSAIRHVADRVRALAELRRVIRPGGFARLIELDPEAPPLRVRTHARAVRSRLLAVLFGPLVVATAPSAGDVARAARAAGWRQVERRDDPEQPVYELRLS